MIEEDKPVHVPTKDGYYDVHGDKTGKFVPREGGSSESGEEKPDLAVGDELDLASLSDMTLDDDLLDLDSLSDMALDDDISGLFDEQAKEEELEKIAASSITLKNYKEAREKMKKMISYYKMDSKAEELYSQKMREILDHSSVASRFSADKFLKLITSGKYMNQFESKSTHGSPYIHSTDGGDRGDATNLMFGTKAKGSTLEERYRWEKYGLLYDENDLTQFLLNDGEYPSYSNRTKAGGEQYGECAVLYNKEKLKGRVTYTLDDSLCMRMAAQRIEETPDQYTIDEYDRSGFTLEKISKLKNIYDVKELAHGRYCEAQIHADYLNIGDYVDAITVPYRILRGAYESDIIKGIQLAQKKYPNIKFLTRDRRDKVREISVDDSGTVIYGDVRDEYK